MDYYSLCMIGPFFPKANVQEDKPCSALMIVMYRTTNVQDVLNNQ